MTEKYPVHIRLTRTQARLAYHGLRHAALTLGQPILFRCAERVLSAYIDSTPASPSATPSTASNERIERAEDWTPIERAYAEAMHEDCGDPPAGHPVDDHSPWSGGDLDGTPTWAEFTAQLARHGLTLVLDDD